MGSLNCIPADNAQLVYNLYCLLGPHWTLAALGYQPALEAMAVDELMDLLVPSEG